MSLMTSELAAEVGYELIKVADSKGLSDSSKDVFRKKQ
jgi:hypothetical protein